MVPQVSVIVPHFNRGHSIGPTLQSLAAQTFTAWELIVIDDDSREDPTAAIQAHIPEARVILQAENKGPAAARNVGIDAARGRYVAFLDSDDYWEPGKLAAQIAAIEASDMPDRIFCVTRTRVVESNGRVQLLPVAPVPPGGRYDDFLFIDKGFAQASSFLLPRAAAAKIRFDETLRQYEDYLFFLAAGDSGLRYLLVEDALVTWHNDARVDRLGRSDNLERGKLFLAQAGSAMGMRARLAFETQFLGPAMFRRNPAQAVQTWVRAKNAGAIGTKQLVLLTLKIILPGKLYAALKTRLAR